MWVALGLISFTTILPHDTTYSLAWHSVYIWKGVRFCVRHANMTLQIIAFITEFSLLSD